MPVTDCAPVMVSGHAGGCYDAGVFVTNFVRRARWAGSAEDAALVIDELVANALTHTHSESVIECHVVDAVLHLDGHDRDPSLLRPTSATGVGGGYGLRVVAAL